FGLALAASALPLGNLGTVGVELTSERTSTYNGTNYYRESAPSMCRTAVVGGTTALTVNVSNVPGAAGYNVYVSLNGCTGPFGYAATVPNLVAEMNNVTSGCPNVLGIGNCALGATSGVIDNTKLPSGWAPSAVASPDTLGAYPPDSEV